MPLIVDHDERRRQIAEAAARLIAERGCENITLREVARAAGFSAAIIGHYFTDKQHMLIFTSRHARMRALQAVDEHIDGMNAPLAALAEFLPLDEKRRREWRMWFGFWGTSMSDPLIEAERVQGRRDAWNLIVRILRLGQAVGSVPADADVEEMGLVIQAMINGLASIVMHECESWPEQRQRDVLDRQIALLCSSAAQGLAEERTVRESLIA